MGDSCPLIDVEDGVVRVSPSDGGARPSEDPRCVGLADTPDLPTVHIEACTRQNLGNVLGYRSGDHHLFR